MVVDGVVAGSHEVVVFGVGAALVVGVVLVGLVVAASVECVFHPSAHGRCVQEGQHMNVGTP